jgi:hypothetical protein
LDVTRDAETGVWSILMEDVSGGISPRGTYDDHKAQALLRAIARMHARWFERDAELEALGLADFRRNSDPLTVLNVHVAHPERPRESWLDEFARDFWVSPLILPVFLDAIPSADADFFVELCADHSRIAAALAHYPHTLLHGDLRRANIAHVGDDVVLFDWELASRGPAARDLQWYWFLHFWAYPVATAPVRPDRRVGLDAYWDEFARACARPPDRAQFDESCDLAWLSILCQIGFLLADPLTEEAPSAEAIARVKEVSAEAIARARALRDRHLR